MLRKWLGCSVQRVQRRRMILKSLPEQIGLLLLGIVEGTRWRILSGFRLVHEQSLSSGMFRIFWSSS